jgi:Golgi SNAP receptor complex protein 2
MDSRYRYRPREDTRVEGFHIQVDELLDTGTNVLTQLREQRESFRSFDERFRSIAANLGMSSTVMRLIERRTYTDKLILFGGMIIFTIFMLAIYFYYL